MNIIKKLEIYGDSILKGVTLDKLTGKYVLPEQSGAEIVAQSLDINVKNYSKFGCTIDKGVRILEKKLEKGNACDMILLEYGGNDCDFNWQEVSENPNIDHSPNTVLKVFEQFYRQIIDKLKKVNIIPLTMSLPPIDAEKYLSWITRNGLSRKNIVKWLGDVHMIYRFQELYSNAITKIARETKSLFVDVRSCFLNKHNFKALICDDGVHPSEEGHKLMRRAFIDFGEKYLAGEHALTAAPAL